MQANARVHNSTGVHVISIASKSRVTPIKRQTIPRIELLGCLSLAKLFPTVRAAITSIIDLQEPYFFSESCTALCCVQSTKSISNLSKNALKRPAQSLKRTTITYSRVPENRVVLPFALLTTPYIVFYDVWRVNQLIDVN